MILSCKWCEASFEALGVCGRTPKFCSAACKQKAYRARRQRIEKLKALAPNRWTRAKGKRPVMVDGRNASSTNPATWSSWDAVKKSSAGDGFGVMIGDGLACIDLDHCFDDAGGLLPWASSAIKSVKPVFIERSMSGDGVHVFHEQEPVKYRRDDFGDGQVEWFSHSRFIRCTFDELCL